MKHSVPREAGLPIYGYRLQSDDNTIDVNTIDNYNKANADALAGRIRLLSSRSEGPDSIRVLVNTESGTLTSVRHAT